MAVVPDGSINQPKSRGYIPLYTHQYERPHNTVLVPCDKLAEMQAKIEALKAENKVLRKGELWLGMVYNNRGNGIAPMYLENFMRFCESNGFTEESGYKLFNENL